MSDDEQLKPEIITCETCVRSVQQPYGTKRTVCPYCGHFYDSKTEGEIDNSIVRLPRVTTASKVNPIDLDLVKFDSLM